ncbi:MAG: carbamate kinase [Actinomycetota bacterium]
MKVVAALGGNAILHPGEKGTAAEQLRVVEETAEHLADLVVSGVDLVITHGNGPQVGRLLLQNEAGAHPEEGSPVEPVPAMPLDVLVAETQGQIGYMLQIALDNALRRRGSRKPVASLLTQVIVDANDPAFSNPTKPIGPLYSHARARRISGTTGVLFVEVGGGKWRRVVPSPKPLRFVEEDTIRAVGAEGVLLVVSGGGGIPVVEVEGRGQRCLRGVEAVVDKDLSAELLARLLGADLLLILTDVEAVYLEFGTPQACAIGRMSLDEARELLATGRFPEGSMGPKFQAAVGFVAGGGGRAAITSLARAADAVWGDAGTQVVS